MSIKPMRVWDSGRNKVKFTRKSEHGKTIIDELKVEWFFYVKNKDYDEHEQFFRNILNCNIVNKYFREQNYTRVYVDRAHNSDSIDMDMNFCWEYKDKLLNDLLLKLDGLGIPHFEADLPVWKRWIVSSGVQMETNLRTLFLDLETDNEHAKGQPIPGEFQILSCAFIDGETGKEAFVIAKDRTEEAEEELLIQIAKIINAYDVLIGFNSHAFDFPYLKVRFAKYGIIIDWRKKHLQDHMRIFRKKGPKLQSYSLDSIAKFVVKRGKVEHEEPIFKMFLNNKGLLREYNLEDVRLMYEIELKTGFLAVDRELNTIGLCPCDDVYISRKIDQLILRRVYESGHFHFKTKERVELIEEEQFEGAYVFEPTLGFHEDVIVFDYSALYPNAIKTFNISPDTLITDDVEIDEKCIIRTPSGACFRKDFIGVLPELVSIIADGRKRYKDLMKTVKPESSEHKSYDRLQYAFKELGLSFYGVCGMPYSRFFDKRVAEAITLSGQFFIKKTAEYLISNKIKLLYGDSVSGDRLTIIVDKGQIQLKSFEELWNMGIPNETFNDKERRIFNPCLRTLSFNFETGKRELKFIKYIIRHKTDKKLFWYRCREGVTRCTEDHSLIDNNGNNFKPMEYTKSAKKVKFPKYQRWVNRKIDLWEFIGNYSYKMKKLENVVNLKFDDNFIGFNLDKMKFKRFIDTNNEVEMVALLSLIAHYICNGSSSTPETTSSRFGASIASNNGDLIKKLKEYYGMFFVGTNVGILEPSHRTRNDLKEQGWNVEDKSYKLQMMNVLSAVIFKQLAGQKAFGKKIPEFIFMLEERYQKFFLDALIEGDGYIEKGRQQFETSSLKLISGISLIMDNLSYNTTINYKAKQKTYYIKQYFSETHACHKIKPFALQSESVEFVYDIEVEDNHNFVDACGNILLHNTDSLFIVYDKRNNIPKILKNIHKVCEHYAKTIFNADNCTLDMAFDKGFRNLILTSKKRYAGMANYLDDKDLKEESLYIAGLEYKRTDSCLLLKKKQEEMLRLLLKDQKPNILEVHAFIKNLKSYVMSKEIKLEDFIFAQKLSKDEDDYDNPNLMHLQVMRQMKEDGKEVWVGDKIPYFLEDINFEGKPIPKPVYRYRGFFAREYYWNNKIYPALKRILEVVYKDIDWDQYDFRLSKSRMGKTVTGRMDLF